MSLICNESCAAAEAAEIEIFYCKIFYGENWKMIYQANTHQPVVVPVDDGGDGGDEKGKVNP